MIWTGDISEAFVGRLIGECTAAERGDLILCSSGGSTTCAGAATDWLSRFPIAVLATGHCYSAAVDVVAAGKRGQRRATAGTRFMLHRCSADISDSYSDALVREAAEVKRVEDQLLRALARNAGRTAAWWRRRILENEPWYFGAEEARELGIIDEVI